MNNKELLKELEKKMARYGYCDTQTHIGLFIKEYEALTKDEKPIRLKDVIKRIQGFDDETKLKWTYDILKELGSDFYSKTFHEAYQQGRFDEGIEAHYGREKVKIPQFVADWIRKCKTFKYFVVSLSFALQPIVWEKNNLSDKCIEWLMDADNQDLFARAWLDGYTIEEKRYMVKMKGNVTENVFVFGLVSQTYFFSKNDRKSDCRQVTHTRKQLEDAGFGEVFNSPLFEVEEVEE
jgi:gp178